MKNNFIFMCLAIGMLSNGFYNDAFAVNATEQTAEIQERILTRQDANRLIEEMEARRSTELVIPEGYTSIGNWAFKECTGLTSIVIPDSVASIDKWAFYGCDNAKFTVPFQSMKDYLCVSHKIADNRIIVNEKLANPQNTWKWPEDGHVKIPQGVTNVDNYMFCYRKDIKSVVIPGSVTSIGNSVFYGCTGLTSIVIPGSVTSIGYSAFGGCTGLTSIVIPDSVTSIGSRAFNWCTGLTSIVIPDSVTWIGNNAFEKCTGLTSIVIPDSVTSIKDGAFYGCTGLTSITIPDSVTEIGVYAFYGCAGLTSIVIPDSVTSIGDAAFKGCTGLTSIVIPDSVTEIGDSAFLRCQNLNKVFVYSDRVKDLVINSEPEIAPDIIEITEKPTDTNSYQQTVEEQELRIQALDEEIANLLANNPVTQERARIKREAEEGYGLELDKDSAMFDDTDIYEQSRQAYETYKKDEEEIAKKRLRLAKIRESLAKKGGK